jgi:hypothetical protein
MAIQTIKARLKFVRKTTAQWAAETRILLEGEPAIEVCTDGTEKEKRGNGVSLWAALPYLSGGGAGTQGPAGPAGPQGPAGVVAATAPISYDAGTQTVAITAATTSAAGSMSAADKAKLDGIAAGAAAPAGSGSELQFRSSGSAFGAVTGSSVDGSGNITLGTRWISSLNGAADAPPVALTGTWFTGGTATTTKPQFLIEPTGTTSTSWSTSGTGLGVNAPSGFTGNLLNLQVNGTSQISVTGSTLKLGNGTVNVGAIDIGAYARISEIGSSLVFGVSSIRDAALSITPNAELVLSKAGRYFAMAGGNVVIRDDATDILAQRRSTNAQTFRCYGTFTDASNYVRAALSSTSTAVTLAAQTAGTGADNVPLNLTAAGAGTVKVNSVAEVAVSSTVADLPATPAVGMLTRVTDATAPAVGSTVAGGGAAAALVWWNGSAWTVIGV